MVIRDYQDSDLMKVLRLAKELDGEIRGYTEEKRCQEHYLQPDTKYSVCVACVGKDIVGYTVGLPFTGVPEIDMSDVLPSNVRPEQYLIGTVFVSELHRRRGIATQLVETLTAEATSTGYKEICSFVAKSNRPSVEFHRVLGFRETGRGLPHYPHIRQQTEQPFKKSCRTPGV